MSKQNTQNARVRLAQNLNPLEAEEAKTLMDYMHARGLKFTHIRNETMGKRSDGKIRNWQAVLDYQAGVSPGFPDFCVVIPNKGLLFIELKRRKGGKLSDAQAGWITALNTVPGVQAERCDGADAAIAFIERIYPR